MLPREHGAYGELALPVLTALAVGHGSAAAFVLAAAVIAGFFAHEPLLVLLGHRGSAILRTEGTRAWRWLLALGALVALALGYALGAISPLARAALGLPVFLVLAFAPLLILRRERTAIGETLAATMLSSSGVPIAIAGGASLAHALTVWTTWAMGLSLSTLAVREVIARARAEGRSETAAHVAFVTGYVLAAAYALAIAGVVAPALPIGLAPLGLLSIGLYFAPPSPRRLRTVGWLLVAASAITASLLIVLERGR